MMAALQFLTGWRGYAAAAAVGAVLLAGAYGAVRWYGHSRYEAGAAAERTRIEKQQAAIERGMQSEVDRAEAERRGAVLARQAAEATVAAQRRRIDGLLRDRADRSQAAAPSAGSDGTGDDWIGILGACVAEYEYMGGEAGRLADKVNGLQGYVRAVRGRH